MKFDYFHYFYVKKFNYQRFLNFPFIKHSFFFSAKHILRKEKIENENNF